MKSVRWNIVRRMDCGARIPRAGFWLCCSLMCVFGQDGGVQSLSHVWLFATHGLQCTGFPCPSLSPGVCSDSFMSIESVMPSNHLIFCCPLVLLPSVFSTIRVFSNQLAFHIRWLNSWSFSFIISPSSEYSGLISFRIDWFDLLAVQRTPQESSVAPQFENINSSVLSLLYGPTLTSVHDYRKNHSLAKQTFVSKVMSLLFNMLSRFVIALLPRSKCLLISWLSYHLQWFWNPRK